MIFGFGHMEEALAGVHNIAPEARSAFANRLKHLQKLEIFPEIRTGRGRAAEYSGHHIYLFGVALQFIELGLTPERAVRAVKENLEFIAIPTRWALADLRDTERDPSPWFLRFDPSTLNSLRYPESDADDASFGMFYAGTGTLGELIGEMGTLWPRIAAVNLTSLLARLRAMFEYRGEPVLKLFEEELLAWLEKMPDDGLPTDGGKNAST